MALSEVKIAEEVWLTCVTHALSTETEEIMGLLLGDIEYLSSGHGIALVWGAAPQTRSDRRKDRVETNPEQLAAASAQAEIISAETGRLTRVIGWYHSHPHITVLPSHVDVRTQGMYQLLDPGFIGLIFSCFNEDGNKVGRIQATAFQALKRWSNNGSQISHELIPGTTYSPKGRPDFSIGMDKDVERVHTASNENHAHSTTLNDLLTNTNSKRNSATDILGSGDKVEHATISGSDIDSFDLTTGMQEAMHLSNIEMSNSEFIRKEVRLLVVPGHSLAKVDFPLSSLVNLQNILFDEERAAYNQAILQSTRKGKVHPLTLIHHSATYQASLCKLMEYCLSPVLNSMRDKLQQNDARLAFLKEEATNLELEQLSKQSRTLGSAQKLQRARRLPIKSSTP